MDFTDSPSGKVIRTPTGYKAFLPDPLPPSFAWEIDLINSLSNADYVLGKLAAEAAKLPNPYLLIRPFIAKEAVLSSKIEGTQATLGEILANEAGVNVDRNPDDIQEVQNYIRALEYGLNRLQELPLSLRLITEIHFKLMQGVRGSHATPGEFRRTQNWIGIPGCTLNTAKYVPPTPENLPDCLSSFETFLHDRSLPPLIHIALCHYQFESIHPFLDGNGRVGRLLITMLLIERNLLPSPILYVSAFFEATREEYYKQLYNVSRQGSWSEWLSYFLNGIAAQSLDVLSRTERINSILFEWQIKVASRNETVAQEIIKHLAVNPFLTIKKISETLNIAFTTAQRAVTKLAKHDIITQVSPGKRDRVFCAKEILAILEEPTKINQAFSGD
ncbi:MAG: Fic family protein [Pseudomonadota bacterium]|nr:Fic family protein [Pseudomonadota bacterium]